MKKLISMIEKSGYTCRKIADYGNIQHETLRWIRSISGIGTNGESPSMLNAYTVRKPRYYVEDKQMERIYKYLGGDIRKTLCIYEETGTGKTVMMLHLYLKHYAEGMCFAFIGCNAYTLSEAVLVLLKQVYQLFRFQEGELDQVYFESEYVQLFQETIRRMAAYVIRSCRVMEKAVCSRRLPAGKPMRGAGRTFMAGQSACSASCSWAGRTLIRRNIWYSAESWNRKMSR